MNKFYILIRVKVDYTSYAKKCSAVEMFKYKYWRCLIKIVRLEKFIRFGCKNQSCKLIWSKFLNIKIDDFLSGLVDKTVKFHDQIQDWMCVQNYPYDNSDHNYSGIKNLDILDDDLIMNSLLVILKTYT